MPDDIRRKRRRKPAERRNKEKDGNRHNGRRRGRIQSGGMNIQTCRHTMTEKWTKRKTKRKTERKTERKMRSQNSRTQNNGKGRNNEIRDIERRRRANGGGARRTSRAETGGREKERKGGGKGESPEYRRKQDTQETENRKSPTLQKRGSRFCFLFSVYSDYVAFIIASRCLSLQATFI